MCRVYPGVLPTTTFKSGAFSLQMQPQASLEPQHSRGCFTASAGSLAVHFHCGSAAGLYHRAAHHESLWLGTMLGSNLLITVTYCPSKTVDHLSLLWTLSDASQTSELHRAVLSAGTTDLQSRDHSRSLDPWRQHRTLAAP